MLTRRAWSAGLLALALVGLPAGCGGSGSGSTATTAAASELQAARKEGEEKARESDRVASLQRQVRSIKRHLRHRHSPEATATEDDAGTSTTPSVVGADAGSVRAFHAPSGNVSCEVSSGGATCTVESVGLTFVLESGSAARVVAGSVLPSGSGELVDYGNVVSVGSITCEVPPSDVPRGITCVDEADGHGFEASRDTSRQKAY